MLSGAQDQALPSGRISLLLTDVEGSTAAWDLDPHGMDARMQRHDGFVEATVTAHGGRLLKSKGEGDSTFSVFADPVAAVAAALDVISGLPGADFDLPVRAAVHTGDVVPRGGDYFGPVPNRAARLRGLACGGQVLLSSSIVAAIGERVPDRAEIVALGTHQLRGLADPEEVFGLRHPDLRPVEPLVVVRAPSNLPAPVDAFVGRDDDRTALEKAIGRHRLVTIVGPGGVGKTRLALETAADQAHGLPSGTWFVDLGALTSPDQLGAAIATAIGADLEPGADAIVATARSLEGRAMIVLDTCEAYLDAAAEVADQLLLACADLSIMATSREPLGVRGEAVLRLDPLGLGGHPDDGPSDAARLFLLRASAADVSGNTEFDLATVERICVALDGIPLAIELAAAQSGMFDLDELANQLASVVGVEDTASARRSGPARQRTVRATVQWSLRSATANERALLSRLTVFVGGWPGGAPEAVCADDELSERAVSKAYAGLVARSLVVAAPDTGAGARHRLLDAVRAIAAEDLDADAHVTLRANFLAWCVARVTALDDGASAGTLPDWVAYFSAEMPNLRACIAHAIAVGDATAAQTISAATTNAWQATGAFADAATTLRTVLQAGGSGAPRARALAAFAMISLRTGAWDDARAASDEAVAIVRADSDLADILRAEVLGIAAPLAERDGDTDAMRALCTEALDAARRSGDRMTLSIALNNKAVSLRPSDHAERLVIFEEAAAVEAQINVSIMARLHYAVVLGLGGYPARALALVDRLDASDLGDFARFGLERVRSQIEMQLALHSDAAATARAAIARGNKLGLAASEVEECTLALGRAQQHLGRLDDALATLLSIASQDWTGPAALRAAEVLLELGRVDEAEEHMARAPAEDDAARVRVIALIALARGRAPEALATARATRQALADTGLAYFEAQLLEVEATALRALGRDDELAATVARSDELWARARS